MSLTTTNSHCCELRDEPGETAGVEDAMDDLVRDRVVGVLADFTAARYRQVCVHARESIRRLRTRLHAAFTGEIEATIGCSRARGIAPIRAFVAGCRVCGEACSEEVLLPVQHGGGCRQCNGSPACSRCGHARRQHRGTFSGGSAGCTVRVPIAHTLGVGRCGCAGYTKERDAFEEHTPIVDVVTPQLRVVPQRPAE